MIMKAKRSGVAGVITDGGILKPESEASAPNSGGNAFRFQGKDNQTAPLVPNLEKIAYIVDGVIIAAPSQYAKV